MGILAPVCSAWGLPGARFLSMEASLTPVCLSPLNVLGLRDASAENSMCSARQSRVAEVLTILLACPRFQDMTQDVGYLPEAHDKGNDRFEASLAEPIVHAGVIPHCPQDQSRLHWAHTWSKARKATDSGCGQCRLYNRLARTVLRSQA